MSIRYHKKSPEKITSDWNMKMTQKKYMEHENDTLRKWDINVSNIREIMYYTLFNSEVSMLDVAGINLGHVT